MAGVGLIRRLLGRSVSEGAAFAIGTAVGPGLRPVVREVENQAWARFRFWPLDARSSAEAVVEGHWTHDQGDAEAAKSGLSNEAWEALLYAMRNAPGVPEALYLWRRALITEAMFDHALTKARIEPEFHAAIKSTKTAPLDPEIVSAAIQRGIMHDPGFLPVAPPTGGGRVEAFPVSGLDALTEAAAGGMDRDRLFVETALRGNPMGPHEAAQAVFRDIIDRADFDRAIAEGNTRNEWRDAIFEQSRQIPTSTEYVNARLRGWITDAEMYAGTARHGLSQADTDLMFKTQGRPITTRQVLIGEARGGTYDGPTGTIPAPFLKAMQEGNTRPEWYNLLYNSRYSLPSAFVIRRLEESGALTPAEAEQLYVQSGWPPALAAKVAGSGGVAPGAAAKEQTKAELLDEYQGGYITEAELRAALTALGYAGPTLDLEVHLGDARRVKTWREKVVKAIHDAYIQFEIDETVARADLAEAGVSGEASDNLFPLWKLEQRAAILSLTPAQIKKAYKSSVIPQADAVLRLEHHGMIEADAIIYLTS